MKLRTAWHDAFGSQSLDFLCIDTEGFEVKVLDGFDWSMPPRIIFVELTSSVEVAERGSVGEYLQSRGYDGWPRSR